MSFLAAPVFTTPLLKIPLLLTATIGNQIGYTIPKFNATELEERQKYGSCSIVTGGGFYYYLGPFVKASNHTIYAFQNALTLGTLVM